MQHPPILETLDPDINERLAARGGEVRHGASASPTVVAGLAMASIPIAIAALARDAFAQGSLPQSIINVLNFALTLEYLENEFYQDGLAASGLIPAGDLPIFQQIAKHEADHVAYLESVLGTSAVAKPTFDFSGGSGSGTGPYGNPFASYPTFQGLSQAFEDTGVRAYKGQAPNLQTNGAILTAALRIHSVEARHACEVRRLRGNFMDQDPNKGWITLNLTDVAGTAAVYAGEDNTVQGGIDVTSLGYTAQVASQAFDEPLDMAAVLAIAGLFISP